MPLGDQEPPIRGPILREDPPVLDATVQLSIPSLYPLQDSPMNCFLLIP